MNLLKTSLTAGVLALGIAAAGFTPTPAKAQSVVDIARVIVDVHDIVYRSGVPYYRYGSYRPEDRVYYVVRNGHREYYRKGPPRGNAYGYYGRAPGQMKKRTVVRNNYYYRGDRNDRDHGRDDDHGRDWDHGKHGRGH